MNWFEIGMTIGFAFILGSGCLMVDHLFCELEFQESLLDKINNLKRESKADEL